MDKQHTQDRLSDPRSSSKIDIFAVDRGLQEGYPRQFMTAPTARPAPFLAAISMALLLVACGDQVDHSPSPMGIVFRVPEIDPMSVAELGPIQAGPAEPERGGGEVYDPRSNWCERLEQPWCQHDRECTDGTKCVAPWWASVNTTAKVCAMPLPNLRTKRWRIARQRVVVDYLCQRKYGCEPNNLHRYFRAISLRESTHQPYDRHRRNPDLEAAWEAWQKHKHKFENNPAYHNPDRWMTGVGMFGFIPAIWLPRWDPMAPPEVLCGEVEALVAYVRAAKDQFSKIKRGVDCNGDGARDFWGTSCGPEGWSPNMGLLASECSPSWYDISLTSSGTTCPTSEARRNAFAARASRVGLDPWGPVTTLSLGRPIPVADQDKIAAGLRDRMDEIPR